MTLFSFGFQIENQSGVAPAGTIEKCYRKKVTNDDVRDILIEKEEVAPQSSSQQEHYQTEQQQQQEQQVEHEQTLQRRHPFHWMDPVEVRNVWMKRRQADIYCKSILETSFTPNITESRLDLSSTLPLRQVMFRNKYGCSDNDEGEDEGEMSNQGVIQAGVYEGGGVVWECSMDLVEYFLSERSNPQEEMMSSFLDTNIPWIFRDRDDRGSSTSPSEKIFVLELGCGHALPSCWLLQDALSWEQQLQRKAQTQLHKGNPVPSSSPCWSLVLVDYNRSVIERMTIPNVILNTMGLIHQNDNGKSEVNDIGDDGNDDNNAGDEADNHGDNDEVRTRRSCHVNILLFHRIVMGSGDWMDMSEQLLSTATACQCQNENSQFQPLNHSSEYHRINDDTNKNDTDDKVSCSSHLLCHDPSQQNYDQRLPDDGYFHIILAAETLYTTEAALETALLIKRHLHPSRGVAYVASKRYYFGVGGGIDDFRTALMMPLNHPVSSSSFCLDAFRMNRQFDVETVRVIDTGKGNIREILRVSSRSI